MASKVPFHRPPGASDPKRIYERTPGRQEDRNFYSSTRWVKLREAFLQRHPCCSDCLREGRSVAAWHVHHIKPRKTHPELAFDPTNFEPLCLPCHNAKPLR